MEALLGTTPAVFLGLTVILFGGAAFMTGQALAETWRPLWHSVPYAVLLGAGARFLTYALFEGTLLSASGYLIGTLILLAISLGAYRMTQARRMIIQYPWLYERAGLFGWREKT
ncbi:MAG: hypothetical protein JO010_06040 [Alphaproteobacteria bacterium]|nr:hypothetical protein [Alphaproteobacteria bacterium]